MFSQRDRNRAITLLEVLVSAGLAFLVFGLALTFLRTSMRVSASGTRDVELQQKMVLLNNRLSSDLRSVNKSGLGLDNSGGDSQLSIHSPSAASGIISWNTPVVLYSVSSGELRRREITLNPSPSEPHRPLSAGEWSQLLTQAHRTTLRLSDISLFQASLEPGPIVRVHLEFSKAQETLSVRRAILLRQGT